MASRASLWEPKRMRRHGGILVAIAALALAGCSGAPRANNSPITPSALASPTLAAPTLVTWAPPSPSPSLSATPTATSATPSPTPSAAPVFAQGDPCSHPSDSFNGLAGIDFDRYARICLGMSFAQASNAMLGPPINGEASCPWYAFVLTVQDPGLYVAAITQPSNPGASISMFAMTWQGDPTAAADFGAPSTAKSISVGSTPAEVKAAYPSATSVTVNDPSRGTRTQLVVAGPSETSMVFDVTSGVVTDMYWGKGISQGVAAELCSL